MWFVVDSQGTRGQDWPGKCPSSRAEPCEFGPVLVHVRVWPQSGMAQRPVWCVWGQLRLLRQVNCQKWPRNHKVKGFFLLRNRSSPKGEFLCCRYLERLEPPVLERQKKSATPGGLETSTVKEEGPVHKITVEELFGNIKLNHAATQDEPPVTTSWLP